MTKAEFFSCYNVGPKDSWKNDYIRYLDRDREIKRALLETGIQLSINKEVKFYTEPGYYERTPIKHSKRFLELFGGI
ncbi:hypothetical protein M3226_28550 [Neobacillus cucumis]|uniref:hypothetical protein n=1 Tax=Neobacillus cucumis TaxID=1740721 RepID=UPI00203D9AC3|nr:hypothetical protein [Neobacillus cucumis]MCM3729539.1 hypothetical protein [Neobacillus cucumis]